MKIQFKKDDVFNLVNGTNFIQVKPSFKNGISVLKFYDGADVLNIIKRKSKQTYEDEKTKTIKHYYNFYLEFDNGVRVSVKGFDKQSVLVLDGLSKYEG